MKTKIFQLILAAMMIVTFAACNQNEVNPRDSFLGTYTYEANGAIDIYANAIKIMSVPLNQTGNFTVIPEGKGDRVAIVGYNDTIHASVSSNTLILQSNEYKTTQNNTELQLHFSNGKATMANNVLTWQSEVTGVGKYNNISASCNGTVSVTAAKQ